MQILIIIGIFAIFGGYTNGRIIHFNGKGHCALNKYWCFKQVGYEYDKHSYDDVLCSGKVCGKELTLGNRCTADESDDEWFDKKRLELYAVVYHNCTMDGTVRKDRIDLTGKGYPYNYLETTLIGPPGNVNYSVDYILKRLQNQLKIIKITSKMRKML